MTRSYGCKPSPHDPQHEARRAFSIAKVAALPAIVDHSPHVTEIMDQGGSGSCVGWGTTRAWHVRARIQGDTAIEYPSALGVYALARSKELGRLDVPLTDSGTYPRLGLDVLNDLGAAPLSAWNDFAKLNDRPDIEYYRRSIDRRSVRYVRIVGAEMAAEALAAGHPLVIGGEVDATYEDYRSGIWMGVGSTILGGHCRAVVGYAPGDSMTKRKFREVNSWGPGWGDGGFIWIADSVMEGSELWAVELVQP